MAVQMRSRALARQFVAIFHHHPTFTLARTRIPSTPNFFSTPNHHFVQKRCAWGVKCISCPDPIDLGLVSGPAELIYSKKGYDLAVETIQAKYYQRYVYSYLLKLRMLFPHVMFYDYLLDPKADDYEADLQSLNLYSTPTFHFYKNGKNVDELVCEEYVIHHFAAYLQLIPKKHDRGLNVPEFNPTIRGFKKPYDMPHATYYEMLESACEGSGFYGSIFYGGLRFKGFEGLQKLMRLL